MKKFIRRYWKYLWFILFFALALICQRCYNVEAAEITLGWDANTEKSVVGYNILVSIDQPGGPYNWIGTNDDINNTEFTWYDILPDNNYYFVVTAFSDADEESGYSNEVCAYVNSNEEYAIECGNYYEDEDESEDSSSGGGDGCFINTILKEKSYEIRSK